MIKPPHDQTTPRAPEGRAEPSVARFVASVGKKNMALLQTGLGEEQRSRNFSRSTFQTLCDVSCLVRSRGASLCVSLGNLPLFIQRNGGKKQSCLMHLCVCPFVTFLCSSRGTEERNKVA